MMNFKFIDNTTEPKTVYKTSDERNSAEVKKLRRELYKFLQQIKQARQMAQNGLCYTFYLILYIAFVA